MAAQDIERALDRIALQILERNVETEEIVPAIAVALADYVVDARISADTGYPHLVEYHAAGNVDIRLQPVGAVDGQHHTHIGPAEIINKLRGKKHQHDVKTERAHRMCHRVNNISVRVHRAHDPSIHNAGYQEEEKYERDIFTLKKHLTSNSCLWEQLAEAEKREKVIKQELVFTQQTFFMAALLCTIATDMMIEAARIYI